MNIHLIRHGQTDFNKEGRIQGQMDIELNEMGRNQARSIAQKIPLEDIQTIISSDSKRALETARIIRGTNEIPITLDKRLREKNYGDWEGKTWDQVHRENPQLEGEFQTNPLGWHSKEGETVKDLFDRIQDFLESLKKEIAPPQKNGNNNNNNNNRDILIVSHNSPIRAILAIAGKISPSEYTKVKAVKNTEVKMIKLDNNCFCL